ncbi:ABC transporter ATP-binding protein, partial [Bacillus subtilis]
LIKNGKPIHNNTVTEAIQNGFAYVTEDRKEYGLILVDDIKRNISLTGLSKLTRNAVVNEREEVLVAEKMKKSMNIKAPSILQK